MHAVQELQGGPKNVPLYFCLLLTDFQNSFTGTLCRQFVIIIYPTTQ